MTEKSETQPSPAEPPLLAEARSALERGDHQTARQVLEQLLTPSIPAPVRQEAQSLASRLGFDRMALALTAGCLLFFLLVVYRYVLR